MKTVVEVKLPYNQLSWYNDHHKREALRAQLQQQIATQLSILPEDVQVTFSIVSPWA